MLGWWALLLLPLVCPSCGAQRRLSYLLDATASDYTYEERWYKEMPIDHFSFADNRTFSLRYLVNDTHWKADGPILLYAGNEGDIELFAQNTGLMWDWAPEMRAMLVFAEHRYYGKSMPFGNSSFDNAANLGHLTSEQALADYAVLVRHLRATVRGAGRSAVVVVGGSYGGMLAAWMRMKYPHIVDGALAASAPVWQFTNVTACRSYNDIVTRTFALSGDRCADTIKGVWPVIRRLAKTSEGRNTLDSSFRLCPKSMVGNESDADYLVDWLYGGLSSMPMVDYPYPSTFLGPVPGWVVKQACKPLNLNLAEVSDEQLMTAMHSSISMFLNYTGDHPCFDTHADTTPELGTDGWDFQACTEMVMPMCSTVNDLFEAYKWDLPSYITYCQQRWFGISPRADMASIIYGMQRALRTATNIIFSNGHLDPWSGGGVLSLPFRHPSIELIYIKEGAHHYDLRARNKLDTLEIRKVRRHEARTVVRWIEGSHRA